MKMYITTTTITPLLLLLLLALVRGSFETEITLSSANDFIDFVNNVNSGSHYSEDTVYLGSDIALSGSIDPIGNETYYFRGAFDGQGYIISNLKVNVSLQYTGLFGYSAGLTISNVVLDDSCSITSLFKGSGSEQGHVGGIIGKCLAISRECNIENSMNMADVTFSGNTSNNLYIGGIIGSISSFSSSSFSSYNAHVKNCVNYGSIKHSGTVGNYAELSGVVGYSYGSSPSYNYIQNCLNYGTITHNGTSANLIIGGIVGNGYSCTYIENCVSAGKVFTQATATNKNYIGSIVGKVQSGIYIDYCYYTSDVNASSINGAGTLSSTTGTPDTPTDVDSELVSKLNANATSCNWSKWFMLHLNGGCINNLSQDPLIGIQGQIPNPVKEGNSFLFWCKDAECTEKFDPGTEPVSGITALYAAWANYTVTFDFGNGTTVGETFTYNTEIIYPDTKKDGYTLSWGNYHEFMPARDITVTAQWTPNNYTVTFDFDNGTTVNETFTYNIEIIYPDVKKEGYTLYWDNYHKLMPARDITVTAQWTPNNYTVTFDANGGSVSETSKVVRFNKKYGELPEPERTEYVFFGWLFTNETDGTEVTNKTTVTTPYNHTLYARWEEVTTHVEIVFNTKDLTNEDVEKLVNQYTEAGFTIVKYENEPEGIRVIVGFVDKEEAENFITNIKESSETTNMVKRVDFVIDDDPGSFSAMVYPLSLLFSALFL